MSRSAKPALPDLFDDLNVAQDDRLAIANEPPAASWKPLAWILLGLLLLNALLACVWFFYGDPARPSAIDGPLPNVAEQGIRMPTQQPVAVGQLASGAPSGGAGSASNSKQAILPPTPVPTAALQAPSNKQGLCLKWGLFNTAETKRAERRLAKQGWAGYLTELVDEGATYMVYVGSYDTKAQLDKKIKDLKTQGVKDFSLIANNSISLGVVSTEAAAQTLKAKLNRQGVKGVQIVERNRGLQRTRYVFEQLTPAYQSNLQTLAEGLGTLQACNE
jgi:hypothetical protein